MSTTEEKITVMQASVDGKEIQVKSRSIVKDWATTPAPIWDWATSVYRVKPPSNEVCDMSTTEEKIAVMQSSVGGKEIQVRNRGNAKDWATTPTQIWNWDNFVYRVKPQPREYYVVLNREGSVFKTCNTLQDATDRKKFHSEREYTIVHVREVMED